MKHIASKKLYDSVVHYNKMHHDNKATDKRCRAYNILLSFVKNRPLEKVENNGKIDSNFITSALYAFGVVTDNGLSFDRRNFIKYINDYLSRKGQHGYMFNCAVAISVNRSYFITFGKEYR